MKVYTRTGDHGETGLYDGSRVMKTEPIFDVLGTIDELSAHIGNLMFWLKYEDRTTYNFPTVVNNIAFLENIQIKLLDIGSLIATPNPKETQIMTLSEKAIRASDIESIENEIDNIDLKLTPLTTFILQYGECGSEAQAHICRTLVRRTERELLKLGTADEMICKFMNRLSDYFFTLARLVA